MDALKYLSDLKDTGSIRHLALTNFDTEHIQMIIDSDIQITSNQIQFSIIDRRPEVKMISFCKEHNISLLAYGSICGGLLSERYVGRKEPSAIELDTLSLRKYKRMIDTCVEPCSLKVAIYVFDHSFVSFCYKIYIAQHTVCWFWWVHSYFVIPKRGP